MGLALFAGLASLSTKALAQVEVFNAGGVQQFDQFNNPLTGTSMSNLLNGWYIEVDDKKFSGFTHYSGVASGNGVAVLASQITVSGNENSLLGPGLEYNSANWRVTGSGSQDTSFNYTVSVLSGLPLIEDSSQTLQQGAVGSGDQSNITITETASTGPPPSGTSLYPTANVTDQVNTAGNFTNMLFDQQFNTPVSSAYVGKDIGINNTGSDTTVFSVLYQNFSEVVVPEPSSLAIAGLGALGMIGYGLRRRKALGA